MKRTAGWAATRRARSAPMRPAPTMATPRSRRSLIAPLAAVIVPACARSCGALPRPEQQEVLLQIDADARAACLDERAQALEYFRRTLGAHALEDLQRSRDVHQGAGRRRRYRAEIFRRSGALRLAL